LMSRITDLETAPAPRGDVRVTDVGAIEFDHVTYDYGGDRLGVRDLSFQLEPGSATGVIGPSGAGKSTLVQLLLGLRHATTGQIRLSGISQADIDPTTWHRLVALVPQEPHLYEATVRDNIIFHRPYVSREAAEDAARAAHVAREIELLPEGFDTMLGPRGAGLSGGQKQRLAIARALAGFPALLVLDEPTSALDQTSEQLVQQTINELKGYVTLVVISHRMSTLSACDRILAFDHGACQEFSTLEQALGHGGRSEHAV